MILDNFGKIATILLCISVACAPKPLVAQSDAPNDANSIAPSGVAGAAGRLAATPMNLYTGLPTISLPLYRYTHHNGLKLGISLDYISGGVQVNQSATPAGLGWIINAGGMITRSVRGMPDDFPTKGYLYNGALPSDYRPYGAQFYHDSLDAEQDVFQFNFNGRTGKFFIGKNGQVVTVPLSKLKISYAVAGGGQTYLNTFYITTEDGVKYIFNNKEWEADDLSYFKSGYGGQNYVTSWYLSQMIAPFGTDTITFAYSGYNESFLNSFPQTVYVRNSDLNASQRYAPQGYTALSKLRLSSITFPDSKNISFVYDQYTTYDGTGAVLSRIKISDSIFRYGYLFNWNSGIANGRAFLHGLSKYTPTSEKTLYVFNYYWPVFFSAPGTAGDTLQNDRDHWGYYNNEGNGSNAIPSLSGVYTGADRSPDEGYMESSSLWSIVDSVNGGVTIYKMEANDIVQYNTVTQNVSINALNSTNTSVSLSQTGGSQFTLNVAFDNSFSRTGSPPFSGSCNLNISITNSSGTTIYASTAISLLEMFYVGSGGFSFSVPNGSYQLKTSLSGCTVSAGSLPVNITWQNQTLVGNSVTMGGLRLKCLMHYDPFSGKTDTLASYSYVTTSGQSSGFLGAVPIYSYPYQQTVINGVTTVTNYTAISSDPINDLNYTQGSPVGYSRVVEYKGSPTHNLGSTVYEFTGLTDAGFSVTAPTFPYPPVSQPDWGMGLPKRISAYDSIGRLIKITHNSYNISATGFNNSNFMSLKLGKISTTYNGDPTQLSTPYTEYYTGMYYYPQSGHADMVSTIDSLYHPNGSIQVSETDFQSDTNYNVVQVTSPYDPSRGLTIQKRLYYPYNYSVGGGVGKMRDSGNISQVISAESWIMGDANPRMISAQITDFQSLVTGHVKPLTIYALQSAAPVPQATIGTFNAGVLVRDTIHLVAQQKYIAYDTKGNLLETRNALNGTSNSIVMDYGKQFPVAQVSNGSTAAIAYSSFESDGWGGWTASPGYTLLAPAGGGVTGKNTFSGTLTKKVPAGNYIVSLWASPSGSASVNAAGGVLLSTAGPNGWKLYQWNLSSSDSLTVAVTAYNMDEVRLYPANANMATFTYEPMIGVTGNCDANNTLVYYSYDNLNRLRFLRDKDQNILKKFDYDDHDSAISLAPNWVYQGSQYVCAMPRTNGIVNRIQVDTNYYSDTYHVTRSVYDHQDCAFCPPPCPTPENKLINCVCQAGARMNTSSVWTKVNGTTWMWVCTYHYLYADGTTSQDYTENDASSCPPGCVSNCQILP